MGNLLKDFMIFIKSLDFIDILFVMSLVALVVLITTLVYIIKVNDVEVDDTDDMVDDLQEDNHKDVKVEDEELDLSKISKEIENAPVNPITLNDYEKEQEEKAIISYDELLKTKDLQEEINYINEKNLGDLTVKSVDVESITRPIELPKIKEKLKEEKEEKKTNVEEIKEQLDELDATPRHSKTILISYKKEEEFLQTLKSLDNLLN